MIKPKRSPKTFMGKVTRNLNRQKQIEAMKKQLLQKARSHQDQKSRAQ